MMNRKNLAVMLIVFMFGLFVSCDMSVLPDKENLIVGDGEVVMVPELENQIVDHQIIIKLSENQNVDDIDLIIPGKRIESGFSVGNHEYYVYILDNPADSASVVANLNKSGLVVSAEQNSFYSLCYTPDDTYYQNYQYAPQITNCEEAWNIQHGSESIVVAVLDTGVNGNHEELYGRVLAGYDIILDQPIPANSQSDINRHGTHVAGIIGAKGDNKKGIAGVNWNSQILPVKLFEPGYGTTAAITAKGIVWAADHGAHVINMSLGSGLYSVAVQDAVNYALEKNIVIVAAMGNDYKSRVFFPASLPGVIAVGATNGRDEPAFFGNTGSYMSVAAPGVGIYSLDYRHNDGYMYLSGTSMAAPFVSGVVSLLLSEKPGLSPSEVKSILEDAADPLEDAADPLGDVADPLGDDDFSIEYGYGRVNVFKTLIQDVVNHYGTIDVKVSNRGKAIGGVKVLLEDLKSNKIVQSGITGYGGIDSDKNGVLRFNNVPFGDYRIRVRVVQGETRQVSIDTANHFGSAEFDFDSPTVLLVNAIKNMNTSLLTHEFDYMENLNQMGRYYSSWKIAYHGTPKLELLDSYDTVIWFTGATQNEADDAIEVFSQEEIAVLKNYLDGGGALYLSGNNVAQALTENDPDFLKDYLHMAYLESPLSHSRVYGHGILENMDMNVTLLDDDQIALLPGAVGLLDSSDTNEQQDWAGLLWEQHYRLVFTSIDLNQISRCEPDTFLQDIILWLEGGER